MSVDADKLKESLETITSKINENMKEAGLNTKTSKFMLISPHLEFEHYIKPLLKELGIELKPIIILESKSFSISGTANIYNFVYNEYNFELVVSKHISGRMTMVPILD